MGISFNRPKQIDLPDFNAKLIEPSAGLTTDFITRLNEFPKKQDGNPDSRYFIVLRMLLCLYDAEGHAFLAQYINSLNGESAEAWPITVLEGDTPRQVLDALDNSYLQKLCDAFVDSVTTGQFEEINEQIRLHIWPNREDQEKN